MTMTLSAETGSTVTFGAINNQFGSVLATATGDGNFNLGTTLSANAMTLASGTIDVTAATGTNVVNLINTSGTTAVNLASGQGADTIVVGSGGLVSITNFQTGAGNDVITLDISDIGVPTTANNVNVAAGVSDFGEIAAAATTAVADNVIILTGGNFATAALAEAAIENNGSRELTINTANEANDDLILVWSDGSNSYIGSYNITSTAVNPLAGGLTTIAEIVGVVASTAGTLHIDNINFIA